MISAIVLPKDFSPPRPKQNKVPTEPGFQKRLGEMYKKVLPAPPKHVPDKRTKANKDKLIAGITAGLDDP
jgi:hypothetical protein